MLHTTAGSPQRLLAAGVPGDEDHGHGHGRDGRRHWPRIAKGTLWMGKGGLVQVHLTCPASHGARCAGTLRVARSGHTLGHVRFAVKRGHAATGRVHLGAKARAAVRRANRHGVRVKVTAGTTTAARTLRAR